MSHRVFLAATLLTVLGPGLLWLTDIPLGIPGEWTWNRIRYGQPLLALISALPAIGAGFVLLLVAREGHRRIESVSRSGVAGWLSALAAWSFAWLFCVQDAPPSGHSMAKSPLVLYFPGSSGYYIHARDSHVLKQHGAEDGGIGPFLASYEETVGEGDVLHVGTHPPGLFVFYYVLLDLVESSPPAFHRAVNAAMPESVVAGFDVIGHGISEPEGQVSAEHRAVLWLAILITHLSAVLSIFPLYLLIRMAHSRAAAWSAVCFWPLLPAVAVYLPKSDVMYTGVSVTLVCLWMLAVRKQSITLGLLAGVTGWLGLFCTLAFLPVGLIAVLASVMTQHRVPGGDGVRKSMSIKRHALCVLRPAAGGLAGLVVLTVAMAVMFDVNLLKVWATNYRNHAAFYDQFNRTWWKWLLVNPFEASFAVGLPVAVLAAAGMVTTWRALRRGSESIRSFGPLLSVGLVWALLWISGKNSGEAARLWIPLMPLLVWGVADAALLEDEASDTERRRWLTLLGLQCVCCLLTVLRVSGFHFAVNS